MFVTRNVWIKYHSPTNGEGNDLGGGAGAGSGEGSGGAAAGEGTGAGAAAAGAAGEGSGAGTGEGSGEGKPTDAEAKLLKEVMDKKSKIKAQESTINELQSKLKEFDGIDLQSVRELLNAKKDEETRKLEEKGQWDSLKKQMVEEFGKEKGTLIADLEQTRGEVNSLKGLIAELTVGNAFTASQFIKEDMTMPVSKARVLYGTHFEFKDGVVVAYDKPAGSAERNILVDAKGDPLSFEAAIKKIVEADPDKDQLLKSKIKPGAGSKTTSKAAAPAEKLEQPTGVSRISAAISKGAFSKK